MKKLGLVVMLSLLASPVYAGKKPVAVNPLDVSMVSIPAGSFEMGCKAGRDGLNCNDDNSYSDTKPLHRVAVSAFQLGKYEITQGQWKAVMGDNNPSIFDDCGDNCPVENASWNSVQTFIQKLNEATGKEYRLPSEAEWEYACRAGKNQTYCGGNNARNVAWIGENSDEKTHPVGKKKANAWGLYDMSGNVWEWVQDTYHDNYSGAPTDGQAWEGGNDHMLRGGSIFHFMPAVMRLSGNFATTPRFGSVGFRLARTIR